MQGETLFVWIEEFMVVLTLLNTAMVLYCVVAISKLGNKSSDAK